MNGTTTDWSAEEGTATDEHRGFWRRLIRRPVAVVCLGYLALIVAVAVLAPILLPDVITRRAGDLAIVKQGPSSDHLLGTDTLGRDVLERLLVGTRITLIGVLEALVVVLALGVPLGLAAGYFGGRLDRAASWLADLVFAVPAIILVLVVLSVFPQSVAAAMVTLGVLASPGLFRVVRSATIPVRQELYVAAAQVAGLSRSYLISRHVFPRVIGPIIVQAALLAAAALLVQTGLAFLGLIAPPPQPSWGGMVADGVSVLFSQPWLIWPPGMAIALTILALGLLGDAVRDASTENWSPPPQRTRSPTRPTAASGQSPLAERTTDGSALVAVSGLTVNFETGAGSVSAIDGVTFDIAPAETVGMVGESGCGKTTTALALLGLLPANGYVDRGSVFYNGQDLATLPDSQLRKLRGKEIGFISQEPMISLNPAFRVGWQLAEAVRSHHGLSNRAAHARVEELLDFVRLPEPGAVARRYPHELSGGMAQRVAIARALAGSPKLLVADEPTTALDVTTQVEILDLLRHLQRELRMAVLLVTHDLGVVADICDRVIVMYAGEVVEIASADDLFGAPTHPYSKALLAANPHHEQAVPELPTIAGMVPNPGDWPDGCHFQPRCPVATDRCAAPVELINFAGSRHTRCVHVEISQSSKGRPAHAID